MSESNGHPQTMERLFFVDETEFGRMREAAFESPGIYCRAIPTEGPLEEISAIEDYRWSEIRRAAAAVGEERQNTEEYLQERTELAEILEDTARRALQSGKLLVRVIANQHSGDGRPDMGAFLRRTRELRAEDTASSGE